MAYKLNGCTTGGLPEHLVRPMVEKYYVPYFVETGTASGDSARLAATMFKQVWTMELIGGRQNMENAPKNVYFLSGNSVGLLPHVLDDLRSLKANESPDERQFVLFYLDAHYSDDVPNESEYTECPVLDEIKAIAEYGNDAIIIIDDARLFYGHPPYPHDPQQWPSICEIFHLLKEKFPYHHVTITDDYIIAIPLQVRDVIDEEWRNRFHIRYPNESDKLKGQVKDVYSALINYIQ